jgi:hypothetical protein
VTTPRMRGLVVTCALLGSVLGGFVVGFLVFSFGYAWLANTIVFLLRGPSEKNVSLWLSVITGGALVIGGGAGVVFWHTFLQLALGHGWGSRSRRRVQARVYLPLGYALWGSFGMLVAVLVFVPPAAWATGGAALVATLAPSFSHPAGRDSAIPFLAIFLGMVTCPPVFATLAVALLKRRWRLSQDQIEEFLRP